jgi:hypothetical protein
MIKFYRVGGNRLLRCVGEECLRIPGAVAAEFQMAVAPLELRAARSALWSGEFDYLMRNGEDGLESIAMRPGLKRALLMDLDEMAEAERAGIY